MKKGTRGEASVHIDASPQQVYEMVADVTRMGEWSPECQRGQWVKGATGPAVGARFRGSNKRGVMRWRTTPRVVTADPGAEFAFAAPGLRGEDLTLWSYRFESDGTGTRVTESFEMLGDMPRIALFVERRFMGVPDRKADLEAAMGRTLDRIKAAAERSVAR